MMAEGCPRDLLDVLCCPDCGGDYADAADNGLDCTSCGRHFHSDEGIYCLTPTETLPDTRFNDPDYQRWLAVASETLEQYFESDNSLFHAIHHSAHRTVAGWTGTQTPILDLGCGAGAHFGYFQNLDTVVGADINLSALKAAKRRYPQARLIQADIYKLPFKAKAFPSIVSVYNLEHIYHLDAALSEIGRVMRADCRLLVGLPCEGGWAWNTGRKVTSERTLGRRYGIDYKKVIAIEHCNTAAAVLDRLSARFHMRKRRFFPFALLPVIGLNLTVSAVFEHQEV